jgi:PKD domain
LLSEKRFLLTAIGLFAVFTLFTAPLFSIIAFSRGGFIQQAFAQEEVTEEEGTTLEVEPTEEPPPPPPPTEEPPPEPDVQEVVPEEGETAAPPTTTAPTTGVEPLTASFGIDSTNGDTAPNATFLFEADVQGGTGPYTYIWNFGDGSPQGSGISIHHTYQQASTYDVTLSVIDSTAPIPQDISVSRQVTVRPATTDEVAVPECLPGTVLDLATLTCVPAEVLPPPTTNATTTLQAMNQTNQTVLPSPEFPPVAPHLPLPQSVIISGLEYRPLTPGTPISVVCVRLGSSLHGYDFYCRPQSVTEEVEPDTTTDQSGIGEEPSERTTLPLIPPQCITIIGYDYSQEEYCLLTPGTSQGVGCLNLQFTIDTIRTYCSSQSVGNEVEPDTTTENATLVSENITASAQGEEEEPCQVLSPVPPTDEVVTTSPDLPICPAGTPPPPPDINPCPPGQRYDEIKGCLCPDGSPPHPLNGCDSPPLPSDECAGIDKAIAEQNEIIESYNRLLEEAKGELAKLKKENSTDSTALHFWEDRVESLEHQIEVHKTVIEQYELQRISAGCKSK